jgi:hypothetical protein
MGNDHIRYDILAQDALRGVIRKVLTEVAATGRLPGDHHFFITFLTGAPGVRISQHLKTKYAEQMTIVVQHQFWDLKVTDSQFEIGLSFSDTPEKLVIPFNAIRGFYDPSVNFELEFDVPLADEGEEGAEITAIRSAVDGENSRAEAATGEPGRSFARPSAKRSFGTRHRDRSLPFQDRRHERSVVNLRQFRKARTRSEKEKQAEQNRLTFGRSKAEKTLTKALNAKAEKTLDQGRLETSDDE